MVKYLLLSASVAAIVMMPMTAEAQDAVITLPATTIKACPAVPYSVGEKLNDQEVSARFGVGALASMAKLPNLNIVGGKATMKSAFAGMRHQAMGSVFAVIACRVEAYILDKKLPDANAKIQAARSIVSDLELDMVLITSAQESSFSDVQAVTEKYKGLTTRADNQPVLDRDIVDAALADFDPQKLFIDSVTRIRWIQLDFGKYIGVSACDKVVKAAISDGASSLQQSLSRTKAIYTNSLDPKTEPKAGLAELFGALSGNPGGTTALSNSAFSSCTADIANASLPPVEASTVNVGTISVVNAPSPVDKPTAQ